MTTYVYLERNLKKFIPLIIDSKDDIDSEARRILEKLIPQLNKLNDSLVAYLGKKVYFRKVESFLKASYPEGELKKEYAILQREKSEALHALTLGKVMDLLEYPNYEGVLSSIQDAKKSMAALNRVDSYFSENLIKFWNGSRFYFNKEEYENFKKNIVSYTKNHTENLYLTKVLNLCEIFHTFTELGLKVHPASLPSKLSQLITSVKTEKNGTIIHEFYPRAKLFQRLNEKQYPIKFEKKMTYKEVPEDKKIDHSSLLVGEYSEKINEVFGRVRDLAKNLNELKDLLSEFYGSEVEKEDILKLFHSALSDQEIDYYLREKYIEKKGIQVPGVPMKMEKLVEMVDAPESGNIKEKIKEVYYEIKKLKDEDLAFATDLSNFWVQKKKKFEVTQEIGQKINEFYTHYTHGYYENILLLAIRQFADTLNDLKQLGYKISYATLPFKIQSFFFLDKENDEIKVKPNIFENENIKKRVKGLLDPAYRFGISKNEEHMFFDVLMFS